MKTLEKQTYNGWTNYETWCANLWLSNDEGCYNYCIDLARQAGTTALLAERLEDFTLKYKPDFMLNAGLSNINWYEIAESFEEGLED